MPRYAPRIMAPHKLGLLSAVGLVVLLVACSGGDSTTAPRRLILANVHAETYPTGAALRGLADAVAADALLGERLRLDLQLGGVLGGEKEVLEKARFGAVPLVATSVAPLGEFSSAIGVLTLPYLFRDEGHFWEVLDGDVGRELLASLEDGGFVGLAFYDAGARSFYNRERSVRRLEDLRGLKIRVQRSEVMREMVAELGASPVALGFKEVYTALHTGAIDGAENNLPSFHSQRHFEVAKHYSLDAHSRIPDVLVMAREAWNRLLPEEQAALRRLVEASSTEQRRLWAEHTEEARRALEAAGVEIVEVADPDAFRRAVEPLYERHGDEYGAWIDRIRATGETPSAPLASDPSETP